MVEGTEQNFYHLMLDVPEDITSPDHYQLLGLERFEDDQDVIKEATLDANEKLLAWQNSDYHRECDHLMDEVVKAREVLRHTKRKAKYDERLRERLGIEESPDASEEPDEEIALAPVPPSRAELRRRAAQQPETDESGSDFDKLFLWGLGGVVAVVVLVGVTVAVLSRPSSQSAETPQPPSEMPSQPPTDTPALAEAPFDANAATRHQKEWAEYLDSPEMVTNSTGMKLVLIPAGEFLMGSPEDEEGHDKDELQHRIRITKPFYLGQTEVTQAQWESVMGTKPWSGEPFVKEGSDYAATYVSWDDAQEFCRRLSEKESVSYRLPTEAEWEYACRSGTTTAYCFGDDESGVGEYAWFDGTAYSAKERYAHQVGLKKANAFGLYDMHGNVFEWCQDWHGDYADTNLVQDDPMGPSSGSSRVLRGGSWINALQSCRSACRSWDAPSNRDCYLGFRVAHSPVR